MIGLKVMSFGFLILLLGLDGCGSSGMAPSPSGPNISISPTSAVAGSADLMITVTGSDFVNADHNKSLVVWSENGHDTFLSTAFVSSTKLTAVIPAALLANSVTASVLVETGDPMGSLPLSKSDSVGFSVTATPGGISISSVSPMSAIAGSPDLMITVTGSNFANNTHNRSFVYWSVNGTDTQLSTTFVSGTQLTAVIPAALLANPVTANVLVETGDPMGSLPFSKSNALSFTVNP